MKNLNIGFENILNAMLQLARSSLKAELCVFLQMDDGERLCVRAADGAQAARWRGASFAIEPGPVAKAISTDRLAKVKREPKAGKGSLLALLPAARANQAYVLVPVSGKSRVIGLLVCGPFVANGSKPIPEPRLRSTGALCAVVTAHWRLYEWLAGFTPEVNHELRTPLTAVQGSIGMVLGGMCGEVGVEVKEMLGMAQKGCERTVRAIEEYLNKQLPTQGQALAAPLQKKPKRI